MSSNLNDTVGNQPDPVGLHILSVNHATLQFHVLFGHIKEGLLNRGWHRSYKRLVLQSLLC